MDSCDVLAELLRCVHSKQEAIFPRDEITYKVNAKTRKDNFTSLECNNCVTLCRDSQSVSSMNWNKGCVYISSLLPEVYRGFSSCMSTVCGFEHVIHSVKLPIVLLEDVLHRLQIGVWRPINLRERCVAKSAFGRVHADVCRGPIEQTKLIAH